MKDIFRVSVAVGILQLIEQGKIRFDDTLRKLLDIDLRGFGADVTVEQLLNHTSGVTDYFDESVMDKYEEFWVDYPNYKIRHNSDLFSLFITKPMMYSKVKNFNTNDFHTNIFSVDAKGTGAGGSFITVKDIICI